MSKDMTKAELLAAYKQQLYTSRHYKFEAEKAEEEIESLLNQIDQLKMIIKNLMPWAVRYANLRRSYVTSVVNEARTDCIKIHGMEFSRDGVLEDKNGYAIDEDLGRWDEDQRKFIGEEQL